MLDRASACTRLRRIAERFTEKFLTGVPAYRIVLRRQPRNTLSVLVVEELSPWLHLIPEFRLFLQLAPLQFLPLLSG